MVDKMCYNNTQKLKNRNSYILAILRLQNTLNIHQKHFSLLFLLEWYLCNKINNFKYRNKK